MKVSDRVDSYIDQNVQQFIDDLRTLVKQPSVSAQNIGMKECAELLQKMLLDTGMDSKIVTPKGAYPFVFGQIEAETSKKTLLLYGHYDVVPPEPLEKWIVDPFSAAYLNDKIVGRGSTDSKGNIVALVAAIQSILRVKGELPVNLKVLFEGEEEICSPNLPHFVEEHKRLLTADAVVCYDGKLHESGRPRLVLGFPGMVVVKLKCRGPETQVHCGRGRLVINPAWRLVWALSSLKNKDERINIENFYRDVEPPSSEHIQLMKRVPYAIEEDSLKKKLGIKRFLQGLSGFEAMKAEMFDPTCNIEGIQTGYVGPGFNAALPSEASAILDFRLVPRQDPEKVFIGLKRSLRKRGFEDVEVIKLAEIDTCAGTSPKTPIVKCVSRSAEEVYQSKPVFKPMLGGSGPNYVFRKFLRIDSVWCGCGPAFSNTHAPNEFMTRKHFVKGIKFAARIIQNSE